MRQPLESLRYGNEKRKAYIQLRRDLRTMGRKAAIAHAIKVVATVPPQYEGMRIHSILSAIPRCGPGKIRVLLGRAGHVYPLLPLSEISPARKTALVHELTEWHSTQ